MTGEPELTALETMAASLSEGRSPSPSEFALRRLLWNFPSGENETFRVLYPDQFRRTGVARRSGAPSGVR